MMETILSIDLDIIMSPCIELYNDSDETWEQKFIRHPHLRVLTLDAHLYYILVQYLLKIIPNIPLENIYFIAQHNQIVNYIKKDIPTSIINIDHHHDWAYLRKDIEEKITQKNQLNCGNWLKFLIDNSYDIKSYKWIHDGNAREAPLDSHSNILKNYQSTTLTNLSDLPVENIDKVILCLSPEFIPPYYHNLFFSLMDICNFIKNTHYNLND